MRTLFIVILITVFSAGCSRQVDRGRLEWMTMDTIAAVQWRCEEGGRSFPVPAVETVSNVFCRIERLLNRFDPESELSRLATSTDDEVLEKCDPIVRDCYLAAFRLRLETDGAFDPRWRGKNTMDLGAIAKGFAVDLAAKEAEGDCDLLVDLGGNLKAVHGDWKIGIAGAEGAFTLREGEACATSAKYFRGDHIRDARTGGAVTNSLVSVTVIHPSSAMLADGLSTVLFILGREKGERFISARYPEARAIWTSR